ncbi:hypothetical protein LJK87_02480 [Paenibacillus sp. P25]|nr:hypothetical protein LJK87_02480 [Paenibacillus sp. P25]
MKAEHPQTTVVGMATAGIPWTWMEEVFKLGGLNYTDAVSIHPYRYPGAPETLAQDLMKLQDLIKRYNNGQTKPIWITELGWPTELDARGVSESVQAQYIVRSHVLALAEGVEKIFWYDFLNDGLDEKYNEHNFGIIRHPQDPKGKCAPKPAYAAYAAMTGLLTGLTFREKEPIGEGIYSYVFDGAPGPTRVVWSTAPKQVKVKTDVPITVTDLMGAAETFSPEQGYVYLTLSEAPIYIAGNINGISEGGKFALSSGGRVSTVDPVPLVLTADNTEPPKGRIQAELHIAGQSYAIDVMPGEKKALQIAPPAVGMPQAKTISGTLQVNGKKIGRLAVKVQIVDPVQVRVKHVLRNNQDTISISVYNYLSREYKLDDVDWQIGGKTGTAEAGLTVPAGSEGSVDITVPALPANQTYPVSLTLRSSGMPPVAYKGNLRMVSPDGMKPFAEKSITADGVLDDLTGVPSVNLTADGTVQMKGYAGPEDLSGQVWVTWDRNNLYMSARIHDDAFTQPGVADGMWQGDGLQFSVSPGMPGEASEWYEYGIALTGKGPQVYRWITPKGQTDGLVSNAQLTVKRDETVKDTIYELALPWSELKPILPDDGLLSFSFLVNDNDGQGRKGWIEWGSGIGGSKDSKLFKPVRLVKQTLSR